MELARQRGDHLAGAGADFADTRDRLERLGLFFDGNSGASAFRVSEEKNEGERRKEVRRRNLEGRKRIAECGMRIAERKKRSGVRN